VPKSAHAPPCCDPRQLRQGARLNPPNCSSFVIPTVVGLYRRTSAVDALLVALRSHLGVSQGSMIIAAKVIHSGIACYDLRARR